MGNRTRPRKETTGHGDRLKRRRSDAYALRSARDRIVRGGEAANDELQIGATL